MYLQIFSVMAFSHRYHKKNDATRLAAPFNFENA